MTYQYQFPAIANPPSLSEQLAKIREECREVMEAYYGEETPERVAEELIDLDHAKEQAIRRLEECGVDMDAVKAGVIAKNAARGYYGEAK